MTRWLDMPPVWLAGFGFMGWLQARLFPVGTRFLEGWADVFGILLIAFGIAMIAAAAMSFRRHQTTIIPHETASALVTTGVFRLSRNPIYLADSLILTGLIVLWGAWVSLPLVPLFMWVIERRFILPEELGLKNKFVAAFARYAQQTKRWL